MRLLDVHTYPPPQPEDKLTKRRYAILSHTWAENEIVFSDLSTRDSVFQARMRRDLDSWRKISGAQRKAKEDGFDFIWIDTLCIDKSSSTELSEAINSMYRWYQEAEVCYVYLSDVDDMPTPFSELMQELPFNSGEELAKERFKLSKWFKRGWTLQELIAPKALYFFDAEWNLIGSREGLLETVSNITRVHSGALNGEPPEMYSIAQRMSWAAGRATTRPEDRAYSLLGILGVSLDIRYGEGDKAFIRLQEEIIKHSADESLFAWDETLSTLKGSETEMKGTDLLAPSPDTFSNASDIVPFSSTTSSYTMTNQGLQILAPVTNDMQILPPETKYMQILLHCIYAQDPTTAILLNALPTTMHDHLQWSENSRRGRIEEIRVDLQLARIGSKLRRLSFDNMSEVARNARVLRLTINSGARRPRVVTTDCKDWDEPNPRAPLWLVFDKSRYDNAVPPEDANDLITNPFEFVASEPPPERDTRVVTYVTRTQPDNGNSPSSSYAIRAQHPSGYYIDLKLVLHMSRAGASIQLINFRGSENGSLHSLSKPGNQVDNNRLRFFPSTYACMCSWKFTAIVRLDREDLSGGSPLVLRLSMVRTSPMVLFKYASWGYEQNQLAWEAMVWCPAIVVFMANHILLSLTKSVLLNVTLTLMTFAILLATTYYLRAPGLWLGSWIYPPFHDWPPLLRSRANPYRNLQSASGV